MKSLFLSLTIFFFLSQLSASNAYSQNFILEFPDSAGGGTRIEKQEHEYMTTYYAYTNDLAHIDISASIYKDLHLTEDDVGKTFIIYSFDNYPGFVTFVDNLTNGVNNHLQNGHTFCDLGGGLEFGGSESEYFGHLTQNGIDFEGYQINSISLYIDSLTIDFDGIDWYDYTIDYIFVFDVTLIDADLDGVPDDQEVSEYSDLDGDGVDDSEQEDMRCLYTFDGECEICIKIPPETSSFGLVRMIEPELIGNNNQKPDDFPFGLLSFRMEVEKGATVTVPIYFSQEIPLASEWYKYDPDKGWLGCSDFAVFAPDRKSVLLTLTDGGPGDIDGRANSFIIDPSGPAVINNSNGYNSGGDNSVCFIAAAAYGSAIEPQVKLLRKFRDRYLLTNPLGQALVNFYYAYSPPIADFIAKYDSLRAMVRISLLPVVSVSWVALKIGPVLTVALMLLLLSGFIGIFRFRRRYKE